MNNPGNRNVFGIFCGRSIRDHFGAPMPSQNDIAAESGAPMIPEQRRELMLRQLRKHQVLSAFIS
jgi:hypothetical protein